MNLSRWRYHTPTFWNGCARCIIPFLSFSVLIFSLTQRLSNKFPFLNEGMAILVSVTFSPPEELIIHESILHSLADLIKLCSVGVQPGGFAGPLSWADGVVFRFSRLAPTDEVFKELLQGKLHWNVVEWALMPQYKQVIPLEEINAKIPVINVSTTTILCEVAKALRERAQKETESASRISWEDATPL